MRKFYVIMLAAMLLVAIVACSSPNTPEPEDTANLPTGTYTIIVGALGAGEINYTEAIEFEVL